MDRFYLKYIDNDRNCETVEPFDAPPGNTTFPWLSEQLEHGTSGWCNHGTECRSLVPRTVRSLVFWAIVVNERFVLVICFYKPVIRSQIKKSLYIVYFGIILNVLRVSLVAGFWTGIPHPKNRKIFFLLVYKWSKYFNIVPEFIKPRHVKFLIR